MMPLSLAEPEKELTIKKLGGSSEIRQHLENLGFTVGGTVTLINVLGENVIVKVKDLEGEHAETKAYLIGYKQKTFSSGDLFDAFKL